MKMESKKALNMKFYCCIILYNCIIVRFIYLSKLIVIHDCQNSVGNASCVTTCIIMLRSKLLFLQFITCYRYLKKQKLFHKIFR